MYKYLSIITIVYNDKIGVERTIKSVTKQTFQGIEYIVIDGGSKDGTKEKIEKYNDCITYWVSERDKGISDAFNKGIKKATGEWIMFLNAGDVLFSDKIIQEIFEQKILDRNKSFIYFGKIKVINNISKSYIYGQVFNKKIFLKRMTICHQSTFFNKEFFKQYGLYNTEFKIAMDYELLLRPKKHNYIFIDKIISIMKSDGISQTNIKNVYLEYAKAKRLQTKKSIFLIYFEFLYFYVIYLLMKIFKKWKL